MATPDSQGVQFARAYISALGDGFLAVNAVAKERLYCQPSKLALGTDNYIDILNRKIDDLSKRVTNKAQLDDLFISTVLINALIETFPCGVDK